VVETLVNQGQDGDVCNDDEGVDEEGLDGLAVLLRS
jgi:hypothetical protein